MNDRFTPESAPAAFAAAARLISYAARRAPPALAERLEEEWLADLTVQSSSFAGLSFALGCCWATRVIAREHGASRAAHADSSSNTVTLDPLRSPSMPRFKLLWIAAAALAATALAFCAALLVQLALRELAHYKSHVNAIGLAVPFAVGAGVYLWMLAMARDQMRVGRIPEDNPKPPTWLVAVAVAAASGTLFALSAQLGYSAMHLAGSEMRPALWGMASFSAVAGAGFLTFFHNFHSRRTRAGAL